MIDAQLDSRGAAPEPGTLKELLSKAHPAQREQAYQSAKRARRSPAADQPNAADLSDLGCRGVGVSRLGVVGVSLLGM